ncbi:MAG: hypothetical protein CMH12_03345 [Maritimibacter sp.]|nr:hypothetical protein [Maritimibacter sp.]
MVEGVAGFKRRMRDIPEIVRVELTKQLEKEAEKVVKLMRAFAPVGATRELIESIGWTWGDAPKGSITVGKVRGGIAQDEIAITIYAGGGRAFYARFQEFGTVNMAANPFFYPAWRAERSRVRSNIKRAVKRGFRKS